MTARGWGRGCRSLRLRAQLCFDRGNVFQYWRTKLEQACAGCFAPQISGWNDSDGEPLARVFAQEHGAGLGAWQTRTRRGDSDSVNLSSNPGPPASYYVPDIAYIIVFLGSLFSREFARVRRTRPTRFVAETVARAISAAAVMKISPAPFRG